MVRLKAKKMLRPERLRSLRELRGLSQQDVADRANTSLGQYSRYERGLSDPTTDAVTRIAQVLETSIDYLVGLVDSPTEHYTEEDLSAVERRLLRAWRSGEWRQINHMLSADEEFIQRTGEQTRIISEKP